MYVRLKWNSAMFQKFIYTYYTYFKSSIDFVFVYLSDDVLLYRSTIILRIRSAFEMSNEAELTLKTSKFHLTGNNLII